MRPIIGITLDCEEKGSFSRWPYYALRNSYFDIIYKAGGLPVAIPYITPAIDQYLSQVSALIVPGGDFALMPEWYLNPDEEKLYPFSKRLQFDIAIIKRALNQNMPFLGICAGMQVFGGLMGGKMSADINTYQKTSINHRDQTPENFAHDVIVEKDSLLYKITGLEKFSVNTAHSEALIEVPDEILISGRSSDGVIEAIECPGKNFALGVQWHPEFFMENDKDASFLIIKALVDKAREQSCK